ncbi:MAG: UDP-glucose 4-epimerase GalE [Chitinivibrionales bacterium]|nr:UDP-glucose 4-epimerase GalE [Chitinivibrionales bacterium]
MKILVIGGAGYIGSHVVRNLLDKHYQVTVFDNLSKGRKENLFENARFIKGDITNYEELEHAMRQGFDGLIHLAALKAAGESMVHPSQYAHNNIAGTINILNAASSCGVSLFVFSSTAAVYGEPRYLPIDENHPTTPMNFYGYTKLAVEQLLSWYSQLKGMKYAALRYFNAAGYDPAGRCRGLEQSPANLLPIVMETAIGMRQKLPIYGDDYETRDGTCIRDYIHVSDLAQAHTDCIDYLVQKKENITVNLGSENGISVSEMITCARKITGRTIPAEITGRRFGDPAVVLASSAQAREKINWAPRYSDMETLIATTWEVYKRL